MDGLNRLIWVWKKQELLVKSQSPDLVRQQRMSMNRKKFDFKKIFKKSKMLVVLGVVLILVLFSVFGIYLPATKVYKSVKVTYADAQAAGYAIKNPRMFLWHRIN